MTLLSIIVPVYNAERYLSRCIESVLRNTLKDWELIIVDDGSTDGSGPLCDHYSQSDERVVVLHQDNRGQSEARNSGLHIAQGKYVTFVDADDEISEDAYLPNIQYLESHTGVDLLQYPTVWNYNTTESRKDELEPAIVEGQEAIFMAFYNNAPINYSVWNKIFCREVIGDTKFASGRLYEDKLFLLEVIHRVRSVYLSSVGEYHYYQYPGSSINKPTFLRRISWVESEYTLLKEMYGRSVTANQKLRRWMDTNRYLAVTHCQFPDNNIDAQKYMMRQSVPSVPISLSKDGLWFVVIKLFGTNLFIWLYCHLLMKRKKMV